MINVLVLEDCKIQRKNLIHILLNTNLDLKIYESDNYAESLTISKDLNIDLFFIDIELKESSGLEFALEIRKMDKYKLSWMVFTTSHINYMIKAFKEVHCYDYILKPYEPGKITELTKTILENTHKKNYKSAVKKVIFRSNSLEIILSTPDIIFIEFYMKDSIIHTKTGNFRITRLSLKKALEIINEPFIVQSHKSFIININYVTKIEKYSSTSWNVYFKDCPSNARIGLNYKKSITKSLDTLINFKEILYE